MDRTEKCLLQIPLKLRSEKDLKTWIISDFDQLESYYVPETIRYAIEFVNKTGPYDGFLGFSQGGFITQMMLNTHLLDDEYPQLLFKPRFRIWFSVSSIIDWDRMRMLRSN